MKRIHGQEPACLFTFCISRFYMCVCVRVSESWLSYSKVVEAEGVGLVLEDVVAESGEDTSQQHRDQDGRHRAAGMGEASGGTMGGHLEISKQNKTKNIRKQVTHELRQIHKRSLEPPRPASPPSLPHSDTSSHTSISVRLAPITMATLLSLWRCDCVHSSPPAPPKNFFFFFKKKRAIELKIDH